MIDKFYNIWNYIDNFSKCNWFGHSLKIEKIKITKIEERQDRREKQKKKYVWKWCTR
jgi:hypothetical protein